jgi:3-keto-disaccharide hydrolase
MRFGLVALLLATIALSAAGDPGWVSLFDGETLDGWRVACKPEDKGKGFWQVRDGAITADSRGQKGHDYIWLLNDGEYGDFELKLKLRAYRDSTGNAGVQVRSRYDSEEGWLDGPQMDVHPPAPFRVGLIYDETRETKRWIHPSMPNWEIAESDAPHQYEWKYADQGDGWNDLHIICKGTRIKTMLNGDVITDKDFAGILDDAAHTAHRVGLKGHIALQLHRGAELNLQYKDIYVKALN